MNGVFLDWIEVKTGEPQVTVLGPLLSNLYINNIQNSICDRFTLILCIVEDYVPTGQKRAKITLLFKHTDPGNPQNYG